MADIKTKPEFERGLLGAHLIIGILRKFGVTVADFEKQASSQAPMLYNINFNIIAPDSMIAKTAPALGEFKTKTRPQYWQGGSISDEKPVPPRTEHGINLRNYNQYLAAETKMRMPVVLLVLSIEEANLYAATLTQLGEPRQSPNPEFPLVNWDVRNFMTIYQFNHTKLSEFFFNTENPLINQGRKQWLTEMPSPKKIDRMLEWLKADQPLLPTFAETIFDEIERRWHAKPDIIPFQKRR